MLQLEIKNIAVNYGKKEVIKDVSCVFNGGDVISLIGPNGTGKTTILKAIAKLISHHGEIKIIQDSEVKTFRESITYVPQMSVNIVNLTVFEMVLLGRVKDLTWKVEKVHLDAVAQILEELHLTPLSYTKFSSLSGGQKQMVIMAQALVSAPKVLLLDEPFSNLDVHLRGVMRDEVKRIQKQFGITMVVVTHDQEDAFRLADRIVVLNNGKIEQIGTPKELYLKPKTEFVAKFIGDSNIIDPEKIVRYENVKLLKSETSDDIIIEKIFFGSVIEYKIQTHKYGIIKVLRLSSEAEYDIEERVEVKIK